MNSLSFFVQGGLLLCAPSVGRRAACCSRCRNAISAAQCGFYLPLAIKHSQTCRGRRPRRPADIMPQLPYNPSIISQNCRDRRPRLSDVEMPLSPHNRSIINTTVVAVDHIKFLCTAWTVEDACPYNRRYIIAVNHIKIPCTSRVVLGADPYRILIVAVNYIKFVYAVRTVEDVGPYKFVGICL